MSRTLRSGLVALLVGSALWTVACGDDDPANPPVSGDAGVEEDASVDMEADVTQDQGQDMMEPDAPPVDMGPYDPGPIPEHPREERAAAQGPLRAGVGFGFLDGPVGVSMAGYGNRVNGPVSTWVGAFKASQGMYGKMTIKAMVLEVEGERLALIKIPTMSSESSLTDGIVASLQTRHGIDMQGRILTGATHSHHTQARYWRLPDSLAIIGADSPDEEVIARMSDAFADTIKSAIDQLAPAEWGFGFQDDWDLDDRIYRDRRSQTDPNYPKDPRLSLLALRRPDGTPMATLINFGMHGTVFNDDNDLLTEDAPGGLEMKFEDYFFAQEGQPIVGMFIQSGGGDASPAGDHLNHPRSAQIELLGTTAAPRIYNLYKTLEFSSEATLAVRSQRIDLRYKWMGYEEEEEFLDASGRPFLWGGWQCKPEEDGVSMQGQPKSCVHVDDFLGILGESLPHPQVHQTFLTVARLNNLFLVTLPGEPAYSVIKHLRDEVEERETPDQAMDVIAFGYSQDHLLYLTHPDDWYQGGYEAEMSFWGPFLGRYLVGRQMQLVDDMLEGFHGPVFHEESPNGEDPKPFEPRATERSLDPGAVDRQPEAQVARTGTAHVDFVMGDPLLGSPQVVLEVESEGVFSPVASKHGFAQTFYDNSRYEMVTLYRPEPSMSPQILPERRHRWSISWQVPVDFPTGNYRFRAVGKYWDGTDVKEAEASSSAFAVEMPEGAALLLRREENNLIATMQLPAPGFAWAEEGRWPTQGWRLLDATNGPADPARVRRPLRLSVSVDGGEATQFDALWSDEAGGHVLDLTPLAVPEGAALTVGAWVAEDAVPAVIQATLP